MNRRARTHAALAILALAICMPSMTTAGTDDPPPTPPSPTPEKAEDGPIPFQILRRSEANLPVIPIRVATERFEVEIAADDTSRRRGLGGRNRLLKRTGMLFIHPDVAVRSYWMYDCLIDMDTAFLDREGRIVAIHRMKREAPRRANEYRDMYERRLKRYSSRRPAKYALEIPPGDLTRLGLRVGQVIELPRSSLDALVR
ncbi:MAG: DUF192 domain-containing protein [Phycisphaeraceae bacterium]|nr:DUF192 domain-containing protein [Phycisphaeraceae bacterium]